MVSGALAGLAIGLVAGLVAGLAGLDAPLAVRLRGAGNWSNWQGRAIGRLGAGELGNLRISPRGNLRERGDAILVQLLLKCRANTR